MLIRRVVTPKQQFSIPILSVGNLIVGGSGKTPFVIALASQYPHSAIISRGYGRKSRGLIEVSYLGKILTDVAQSGDEAMLMALSLPKCSVIVSEDRKLAIDKAIKNGANRIILDDAFGRVEIKKYEILLEPAEIKNPLTFPSGPMREFAFTKIFANQIFKEGRDFSRVVSFENLKSKMLLLTAISQPQRLDAFLPNGVISKHYLQDHSYFDEREIEILLEQSGAESLLVTAKDAVKLSSFKFPLSIMKLELILTTKIHWRVP